jgi:hypothetical protein
MTLVELWRVVPQSTQILWLTGCWHENQLTFFIHGPAPSIAVFIHCGERNS